MVEADVKAQPVPARAYDAGLVLRIGAKVGLLLGGHGKMDLRRRAASVLWPLRHPDGRLDGSCSAVSHALQLLLDGLSDLRLVVNGDKAR